MKSCYIDLYQEKDQVVKVKKKFHDRVSNLAKMSRDFLPFSFNPFNYLEVR